jgi:hypothetical protein
MIPHLRPACFALGLVAMATPAAAQTWVYENGSRWNPAGAQVYTAPEYVAPSSRTVIDRTVIPQGNGLRPIVRERVVTDTYNTTVTAPLAAAAAVDAYAYVPPASYVPAATYAPAVAPAYSYNYNRPLDDRYYYGPRYTETVVDIDTYTYVPRRALPVTRNYAYAPRVAAEAYAYVPNGAAGPRLVTTTTLVRDAAYCARRYRSYDAVSGTFLGFDGFRHACP